MAHLRDGLRFLKESSDRFDFAGLVSPPQPLDELTAAVELVSSRRWARVAVRA